MRSLPVLRRVALLAVLIPLGVWLGAPEALAESVYVLATNAQLRAGKTSLDKVTANLRLGDELTVLKRDGTWLEVKTASGERGWIFANKVSSAKPKNGDNELAALGKSFRRTEASGVTASAGSRGLDKVSEGYAQQAGITKAVQDSVDRMAAYRVTDQDVEDFLQKGRLGEYAQ
jgi:uncharacterized protein YgiM (DUF1202 family)